VGKLFSFYDGKEARPFSGLKEGEKIDYEETNNLILNVPNARAVIVRTTAKKEDYFDTYECCTYDEK
jgi:hypothetical protein